MKAVSELTMYFQWLARFWGVLKRFSFLSNVSHRSTKRHGKVMAEVARALRASSPLSTLPNPPRGTFGSPKSMQASALYGRELVIRLS